MAKLRFRRKSKVEDQRRRGAAPLLPEPAKLSGPARRVNRFVAAVALFGAFGTIALAAALTPGAQTAGSSAKASHGAIALSEVEAPVLSVVEAKPPVYEIAALPPQASKSDRLSRSFPATPDARADLLPGPPRTLRGTVGDETAERGVADIEPELELDVATVASEASVSDGTGAEDIDDAIDNATEDAIEEAVAAAVEEAIPEASPEASPETSPGAAGAARTAPVRTDVNMRARPDNAAAVITVVPGRSEVEVIGCDYWCEVVFAGQRGWIYKGFIPGAES